MIKILFVLVLAVSHIETVDAQALETVHAQDTTFSKVEVEADFPGGVSGWRKYLENNLNADVPAKKRAPAGTYMVIIKFIVEKNGAVSNITPETNLGYGMEKEVVRVIKNGPEWTPAMQDGRFVRAYRRQPVTFLISEK